MLGVSLGATLSVVWLETTVIVTRVVVLTRVVVIVVAIRVAWLTIVGTRCILSNIMYNALLFHECKELFDIVGVVIELKWG